MQEYVSPPGTVSSGRSRLPLIVALVLSTFLMLGALSWFWFSRSAGPPASNEELRGSDSSSSRVNTGPAEEPLATTDCDAVSKLSPESVAATSTAAPGIDAGGNPIDYEAENTVDGQSATAWRTEGNGIGQEILILFSSPVHICRLGIIPGYSKIDPYDNTDRFKENRVIEVVEYESPECGNTRQSFSPSPRVQLVDLSCVTDTVVLRILSTSAHGGRDFTAISEIEIYGEG